MSNDFLAHNYLRTSSTCTLHYVEQEPSSVGNCRGTVVLVHGFPEFWYSWRHIIPTIAAAGFRVLAVDLRGYGETRLTSHVDNLNEYTFKAANEDFTKLLDFHKTQKAIFIGHDWGGAVVWRMAQRFPDRVLAVASICTPFRPRSSKFWSNEQMCQRYPLMYYQSLFEKRTEAIAKELEADTWHTVNVFMRSPYDESIGHWPKSGDTSFLSGLKAPAPLSKYFSAAEIDEYAKGFERSGYRRALNWYKTGYLNWKDDADLPKTISSDIEALMVSVEGDKILDSSMTAGMEQWVPKLTRGRIIRAGHWVTSEQPAELGSILVRWLDAKAAPRSNALASSL